MTEPLETTELLAFTRTVETGSLSRAAVELALPRATVSKRLARLEQRLGTRLLARTTRTLKVTAAGEALYAHACIVLDAVKRAEASVRRPDGVLRGELRVSVPPVSQEGFHAFLTAFAAKHPGLQLHVQFNSALVDLRRDGFDVALRAALDLEPGLVARVVARSMLVAVASPAYLKAHGTPTRLAELTRHRCLMNFTAGSFPQTHWPTLKGGKVALTGTFFSNHLPMLKRAALDGLGITLLPDVYVAPQLADGSLLPVLPKQLGAETRVAVVFPEREFVPPQVRAFVDALVEWMETKGFSPGSEA